MFFSFVARTLKDRHGGNAFSFGFFLHTCVITALFSWTVLLNSVALVQILGRMLEVWGTWHNPGFQVLKSCNVILTAYPQTSSILRRLTKPTENSMLHSSSFYTSFTLFVGLLYIQWLNSTPVKKHLFSRYLTTNRDSIIMWGFLGRGREMWEERGLSIHKRGST